ncbi:MAG: class I mannose-6-phosphate isomerase [Bacteroidales bacterium]|nr:class I mannose-6-phosphate isomerase [Bacteroidales bacterium]
MIPLYPLHFRPWLRSMVWGGDRIAPFKGVSSDRADIGESWEISAVEGHLSVVENGPLAGRDIRELAAEYQGKLLGDKVFAATGEEFPLLIKFIDARQDLSIQVHPDDAMAERLYGPGRKGKTEMWYVVSATPGAYLLSGLTRAITPEDYVRLVEEHRITDVLARHELTPGDVFFLPAGRIHAIGAGSFVAEIQQTSDYTYRIYDYDRPGLDGKPRELHTELAKEAIDYQVYPSYKTDYEPRRNAAVELVRCPYFTTTLLDLDAPMEQDLSGLDSFLVVICVGGAGSLSMDGGTPEPIRQGETLLLPACARSVRFEGTMKLLTSCL